MASSPRTGTYAWVQATHGILSPGERRRALASIALGQVRFTASALRRVTGRRADRLARIEPADLVPPRSSWTREAEEAVGDLPAGLWLHSLRAWQLGTALATLDGATPDPEVLYVAAVLHDLGLADPQPGTCFTLVGADAAVASAEAARVPRVRAERAADAICLHVHPGLRLDRDGPEATYLQVGTMADVTGQRVEDVDPGSLDLLLAAHPRRGFTRDLDARWRHECALVPGGRAELVHRYGGILLAAKLHPLGG